MLRDTSSITYRDWQASKCYRIDIQRGWGTVQTRVADPATHRRDQEP